MTTRVGGLWHCAGRGGGDGNTLSIIKYSNFQMVGAALSSALRHTPIQIERAKRWAGYPGIPRFHEVAPDADRWTKVPGIEYHETMAQAALAAVSGAEVVLSWGFPIDVVAPAISAPIVEVLQGMDGFATPLARRNAPHADVRIAVSEAAGQKVYGSEFPYIVCPNGCDPSRALPSLPGRALRKAWGIPDDAIVVTQIQRLTPDKNPEAGVMAMAEFRAMDIVNKQSRGGDVYLVIVGSSSDEDINRVQAAIHRLPNSDRVCWVNDAWCHIGDVLASSDVFLLASNSEGWSVAVMEAMFAGVPCVLSANESHIEMRRRLGDVFTMIPHQPTGPEVAAGIQEAIRSGKDKARVAREIVMRQFTHIVVAKFYQHVISEARMVKDRQKDFPLVTRIKQRREATDVDLS